MRAQALSPHTVLFQAVFSQPCLLLPCETTARGTSPLCLTGRAGPRGRHARESPGPARRRRPRCLCVHCFSSPCFASVSASHNVQWPGVHPHLPLCLNYLFNPLVLKVYAGQARGYSLPLVRISKGMGGGLEKHPKFFDFRLGLESCLRVVVWGEGPGKRGDGTKTRAWVQTQTHVSGSSFHLFFEARLHFLSCKLRPNLWSDSAHQESWDEEGVPGRASSTRRACFSLPLGVAPVASSSNRWKLKQVFKRKAQIWYLGGEVLS